MPSFLYAFAHSQTTERNTATMNNFPVLLHVLVYPCTLTVVVCGMGQLSDELVDLHTPLRTLKERFVLKISFFEKFTTVSDNSCILSNHCIYQNVWEVQSVLTITYKFVCEECFIFLLGTLYDRARQ